MGMGAGEAGRGGRKPEGEAGRCGRDPKTPRVASTYMETPLPLCMLDMDLRVWLAPLANKKSGYILGCTKDYTSLQHIIGDFFPDIAVAT